MRNRIFVILVALSILGWNAGVALADLQDSVGVTATVSEGISMVDISQSDLAFGTVSGTVDDHRFSTGPMTVSYFAAAGAWKLTIMTNNDPGTGDPEKAGLVGDDGTTYRTLKVWCANYGPEATMPDPEDDAYWVDNATGWYRIPEVQEVLMNPLAERKLCYAGAELDAVGFDCYLAFDAQGLKAQGYSTTAYVMIIHE